MARKLLIGAAVVVALGVVVVFSVPKLEFIMGGAMVNVGYRLQDSLHAYDFEHTYITPEQTWDELKSQNELASSVRNRFPRHTDHPVMAILVCMDARIDTNELTGDTRHNAYIVRTAGSVIGPEEADMLELAVNNGVKLLLLTRHTDCAAEKTAKDASKRSIYPALVKAVEERDLKVKEFLARPAVAAKIASGQLLVKEMLVDTATTHLEPLPPSAAVPPAPEASAAAPPAPAAEPHAEPAEEHSAAAAPVAEPEHAH